MRIRISRENDIGKASDQVWKDFIGSLVLMGYAVTGDENQVTFLLGNSDEWEDIDV